jgi:hypothetical protein
MRLFNYIVTCAALLLVCVNHVNAREWLGPKAGDTDNKVKSKAANCAPAVTLTEFFANNVRTAAETGGNTWYDRPLGNPYYEVPAEEGNHAIFAGALWMGGRDPGGNLKLAAVRFRQVGNDYWPGPLSTDGSASTTPESCLKWDNFYSMSRNMVERHRYFFTLVNQGLDPFDDPIFADGYSIPSQIMNWPAAGDATLGQSSTIAPFADLRDPETQEVLTTPDLYEPEQGDYPLYDLEQEIDCRTRLVTDPVPLFGDFTMFWVFNDNGNIHTESQGQPIGMEIQAQMFGFTTNDEINNMTFCNYVLINRGTLTLNNTYFAQWVDTDLGNFIDDYVGCDVGRGLAYSYNGDDTDEGSQSGPGYGSQPPAIGVDFFEGPYQDLDGVNNLVGIGENEALNGLGYLDQSLPPDLQDTIVDNERFGMRRFVFHSNVGEGAPAPTTDPTIAIDYYNMMRGIWKDGTPMTVGGRGYNPDIPGAVPTDFMFPGTSDPLFWGTGGVDPNFPDPQGWTEETANNPPGDRRFLQSAGPFTLSPGQFNNITVGVVYARAQSGGPFASVRALLGADDKAQALFENCFRLLDGPDAPDLTFQELDKEILLYIRNTNPISNNVGETYEELDPTIPPSNVDGEPNDQFYRFQGYQIYQLRGSEVSIGEIDQVESARLIFQCDVRDGISQIVNYEFDPEIGLPVPREKVNGANEGIRHSFRVVNDQFAAGDNRLVNFKQYYFIAVAYGHNEYQDFNPDPDQLTGQALPYIRSRQSPSGDIQPVVPMPHKPDPRYFGTVQNSQYGDQLPATRIEGQGNGANGVQLAQESIEKIMAGPIFKSDTLAYLEGRSPLDVKIIDPLSVQEAEFELRFYSAETSADGTYSGSLDNALWYMFDTKNPSDTIVKSEQAITLGNEQILPEFGISVNIGQVFYDEVGDPLANILTPRLIFDELVYGQGPSGWLTGVSDVDGSSLQNWIRAGRVGQGATEGGNAEAPCFFIGGSNIIDNYFFNDYNCGSPNTAGDVSCTFVDPDGNFEAILNGIMSPARLASAYDCGIAPLTREALLRITEGSPGALGDLTRLHSLQLSITPDKSQWSRCAVLEMSENAAFAEGGGQKMNPRVNLSVDKNGRNQLDAGVNMDEATFFGQQVITQAFLDGLNATNLANYENLVVRLNQIYPQVQSLSDLVGLSLGMGYFPGYAINPDNGERLNVMFGENSFQTADNGRDMLWNPSPRLDAFGGFGGGLRPIWGGEHYVYVLRNDTELDRRLDRVPLYDGGQYVYDNFMATGIQARRTIYRAINWIMNPLLDETVAEWQSIENGLVPGEATINIGITRPYESYATVADELGEESLPYTNPNDNLELSSNQWWPVYRFSTSGFETVRNNTATAESALDLIDVVPNPYYAYSAYETGRVDNRVRLINLPPECKIQIFTINGTLVRILEKDNALTWIDWNLQNDQFIPIAGGMYLIHVQSPGLGERVLKFFCATRPTDLRNF